MDLENDYDRRFGDCGFRVIRRGDDFRFIPSGGGIHRTVAMAALGHAWVPGHIYPGPFMYDCADVDHWPLVRQGVWSRRQALAYVDHLFDYNVREWYMRNMQCVERTADRISKDKIEAHAS